MLHPARVLTAVAVLVLGLALRTILHEGGWFEPGGEEVSSAAAVRQNQPVAEQLAVRWRIIPDVLEAHVGYAGTARGGVVDGFAVCERCDLAALQRRLVRDVWTSELVAVERFRVRVAHDDRRGRPLVETWVVDDDAAELYDRYGNGLVDPDKVGTGS